jgi:hypothetical protein
LNRSEDEKRLKEGKENELFKQKDRVYYIVLMTFIKSVLSICPSGDSKDTE